MNDPIRRNLKSMSSRNCVKYCGINCWFACLAAAISFLGPASGFAQRGHSEDALVVENLWPEDIRIGDQNVPLVLDAAFSNLWREALKHPETDLRQELISSIEQVHRAGDNQSQHLETVRGLIQDDNHPTLNIAIASFLVAVNDKTSADLLFKMIRPGQIEISQIVEPALARWSYSPAIELWKKRLNAEGVRRTHLILAINGLAKVDDSESLERLLELATDFYEKPSVRLAAARSAGSIGGEGLIEHCTALAQSNGTDVMLSKLCSIALMANIDSQDAIALLQELMCDDSAAVAGAAWQRMVAIDSSNAIPYLERCAKSQDPIVGLSMVSTCVENANPELVDRLGDMLGNRHPDVRVAARNSLRRLAKADRSFDQQIRSIGQAAIQGSPREFRKIEQAVILLTELNHKPAAGQIVELLSHEKPQVYVTAAWSLRSLNEKSTFESMLRATADVIKTKLETAAPGRGRELPPQGPRHDQLAHLFEAFGEANYQEAKPLVRKYVFEGVSGTFRRPSNSFSAAISAVGKLYLGDPSPSLVSRLSSILGNVRDGCPNDRAMAIIAMGRMKAESQLPALRKYYPGGTPDDPVNYAAAWSIREMTGEAFLPPKTRVRRAVNFGLIPTGKRLLEGAEDDSESDN